MDQHWWNAARIWLFFFVNVPAMRQYYFYVTDPNITRMGSQAFVLFLIVTLETLLVYKTAPDDIPPAPFINKLCWSVAAIMLVFVTFFIVRRFDDEDQEDNEKKTQ